MGLLAASTVDAGVFAVSALAVLVGAFGVILSRNPVHAALMLVLTLFGVAVLFVAQEAHFLAAVQIIVYAGAIVVLFLFVIMLLGVDNEEDLGTEPLPAQRPLALLLGALAFVMIVLLARGGRWATGISAAGGPASGPGENVEKLGRSLFTTHLLAFEVTGVLLVIAVVGTVVFVRRVPPDAGSADADDADDWQPVTAPDGPERSAPDAGLRDAGLLDASLDEEARRGEPSVTPTRGARPGPAGRAT